MKCEVCKEECEEYDIKKLDKFDIFSVRPKEVKELIYKRIDEKGHVECCFSCFLNHVEHVDQNPHELECNWCGFKFEMDVAREMKSPWGIECPNCAAEWKGD